MVLNPPSAGIRALALRGFTTIGAQRFIGLAVTAVGGIVLARQLAPKDFGAYAVIAFAVGLGVAFGELGLGSALIQRRDIDITRCLGKAFALQLLLTGSVGLILSLSASSIAGLLGWGEEISGPIRYLTVLLPLSALRMPPTVILERNLSYLFIAISDMVDTLTYYSIAALIALAGGGVWSFVYGAIAGRVVGLIPLWWGARWKPSLKGDWNLLFPSLKFGIFFQLNNFMILLRDSIVPLFITATLGVTAVGFLSWASAVALLPLQIVNVAGRILVPALSQFQENAEQFAVAFEQAFNRLVILTLPAILLLLTGADKIVHILYGDHWVPAIPAVRLFGLTCIFGGVANLFIQALYSLGRADLVFRLIVLWAVLIWGLTPALLPFFGFNGFAIASVLAAIIIVIVARIFLRFLPMRLVHQIRIPLIAGCGSTIFFVVSLNTFVSGLGGLIIVSVVTLVCYALMLFFFGDVTWRSELLSDLRRLRKG